MKIFRSLISVLKPSNPYFDEKIINSGNPTFAAKSQVKTVPHPQNLGHVYVLVCCWNLINKLCECIHEIQVAFNVFCKRKMQTNKTTPKNRGDNIAKVPFF